LRSLADSAYARKGAQKAKPDSTTHTIAVEKVAVSCSGEQPIAEAFDEFKEGQIFEAILQRL
jgi:hypothetical protein